MLNNSLTMTLKELIGIIDGAGVRIDRVAGFCDGYEQMFDRCRITVREATNPSHYGVIYIDTGEGGGTEDDGFYPVPKMIDKLHAEAVLHGGSTVYFTGLDNVEEAKVLYRDVMSARVVRSGASAGLSLLGPEPMSYYDDDAYLAKVVIEDPMARSLNAAFAEFLEALAYRWDYPVDDLADEVYVEPREDYTVVSFVSWKEACESVAAMLAVMFAGVYFTITPLTGDEHEERLSNDRDGKYFAPWRAVVYPAYEPHNDPELTWIADAACYAQECDTAQEMEQFIANHHPNARVGDLAQRITSRYIDSPLELIMHVSTKEH